MKTVWVTVSSALALDSATFWMHRDSTSSSQTFFLGTSPPGSCDVPLALTFRLVRYSRRSEARLTLAACETEGRRACRWSFCPFSDFSPALRTLLACGKFLLIVIAMLKAGWINLERQATCVRCFKSPANDMAAEWRNTGRAAQTKKKTGHCQTYFNVTLLLLTSLNSLLLHKCYLERWHRQTQWWSLAMSVQHLACFG